MQPFTGFKNQISAKATSSKNKEIKTA